MVPRSAWRGAPRPGARRSLGAPLAGVAALLLLFLQATGLPLVAQAGPRDDGAERAAEPARGDRVNDPTRGPDARRLSRRSRSIGWPWRGRLEHGVELVESPVLVRVGEYREGGHFFGTWELVQLIERAAWRVHLRHPGAKLPVGELSRRTGGRLDGHRSHRSGRDADIGFYLLDAEGRPVNAPLAFARVRPNGSCTSPNTGFRFDDARNWELVAKLVADGDARVQYIFVHRAIKRRLLDYGRRIGAPRVLIDRAAQAMIQPAGSHPHRNHFHVRIYCAPGDRPRCKDRPPFHDWYPGR